MARKHLLQAQDERRRHRRRHPDVLAELVERPMPEAGEEDPRLAPLRACLRRLSAQARQLIDGFYTKQLSLDELAQQTRRTRAAVAMALSRIRSALHDCVAKAHHD
jgi:DNA-directed RNA polymerase specialized sigma24 family protein